ncbi:hypothetical protein PG996_011148 [Apiospora saccharicola]|uniref:Rhodopsin domain-containing protein n=1 Tax=Apiospora saccharicola TaxID=335842 RepID=A0ABR1UE88_9PEZI
MEAIEFWALPPAEREKLLEGPALEPPPGVEPNFDKPPNGNAVVIAVCGTCLVVGSFFVFLFTLATNFFTTTILLLKTAILLEWLRLFVPGPGRNRRRNPLYWISVVLLAVNGGFNAAAIVVVNLACIPHEKSWNPLVPGRCFDGRVLFVASAVVNFAIDLAILVLPQKVIWGLLQLSFRKRLGVSVVFVVGVISACFAAAFRIPVSVRYSRSQDHTYDFCIVGIWAMVEATCGLIVYCTPALPKALSKLRGSSPVTIDTAHPKPTGLKMSGVWKSSPQHHDNNATRDGGGPESHRYLELRDYRHPTPSCSEDQVEIVHPAILRTTRIDVHSEYARPHGAPGVRPSGRELP